MKNYKKFLIILLCIIMIIIVFSLGYLLGKKGEGIMKKNDGINAETDYIIDEVDGKNIVDQQYVSGMLETYKYIDRDIELEYFYKLDNTSTYEQILEEIGEANGQFGSGMIYKYYEIDDNLYVSILFSSSENKLFDRVLLIRLCTQHEVLDTIYPR